MKKLEYYSEILIHVSFYLFLFTIVDIYLTKHTWVTATSFLVTSNMITTFIYILLINYKAKEKSPKHTKK